MRGLQQNSHSMRQLFLASCFAIGVHAQIGSVPLTHSPGHFFSSAEWANMGHYAYEGGDLIILANGTKLFGELEVIPTIAFSFGPVDFDSKEVSIISFAQIEGKPKVQIIMRNGQNYIGALQTNKITFKERLPYMGGDPQFLERRLDPSAINFIALQPRGKPNTDQPQKFYNLTMQNGDQLSVFFEQEQLHLSDGWRERIVDSQQFVEATFNGGLQGTIETSDGLEEIGFAFVAEPQLCVRLPNTNDYCVSLPWEHVASLKADFGHKGTSDPAQLLADLYYPEPSRLSQEVPAIDVFFAEPAIRDDKSLIQTVGKTIQQKTPATRSRYEGMVLIPGGQFYVSVSDQIASKHHRNMLPTAHQPSIVIEIPAFYVDRHEVTNAEYDAFTNATGYPPPVHWINGVIPTGSENQPVVNVSYMDASLYAEWAGKRLPNEIEWQRASEEATTLVALQEASSKQSLTDQAFSILSLISGFETVLADEPGSTAVFGYLMDDVGGRVAEWTSSRAVAELGSPLAQISGLYYRNAAKYGDHQVVRKGFVQDPTVGDYRTVLSKTDANETTGFRCVAEVY